MTQPSTTRKAPTPAPAVSSLVRTESPEEREYAHLQVLIQARTGRIRSLEEAISPLEQALARFERDYQAGVGGLLLELRELTGTTEKIEHRTARIHARLVCDPGGLLGDIFDREELTEIGQMFGIEIPASWFAAADNGSRGRNGGFDEDEQAFAEEEILRRLHRKRHATWRDADPQLRTLYKELARRFHPDLARDEQDRGTRQEMMLRINAAWQARDLSALRSIHLETEHLSPNWHRTLIATRLAWARRECARLDERIVSLEERLRTLRTSDTFPLWFDADLGRSVISRQAMALRTDIVRQKERLGAAREAFRQALHAFAVASNLA